MSSVRVAKPVSRAAVAGCIFLDFTGASRQDRSSRRFLRPSRNQEAGAAQIGGSARAHRAQSIEAKRGRRREGRERRERRESESGSTERNATRPRHHRASLKQARKSQTSRPIPIMESIKSNSSKCAGTCETIVKRALGAHHDSHALFIYVYINNYRQHPSERACVPVCV